MVSYDRAKRQSGWDAQTLCPLTREGAYGENNDELDNLHSGEMFLPLSYCDHE
jgi:hypothetical protein